MAIHIVPDVPLLPQDMTNACWYFSGKMIAAYSAKGNGKIKDPSSVTVCKNLYTSNSGWAPSTFGDLATHLGLETMSRKKRGHSDYLTAMLVGPMMAAGLRNGNTDFPHVVVLAGVADTGVLVHDPLPEKTGEKAWKTWDWLDKFLALSDPRFDYNLLKIPGIYV